jgi:hypothetical protein
VKPHALRLPKRFYVSSQQAEAPRKCPTQKTPPLFYQRKPLRIKDTKKINSYNPILFNFIFKLSTKVL